MPIKMLIENLRWHAYWCDRTVNGCTARQTLRDAADALEKLDKHGRWDRSGYCSQCDFWTCYCGDYHYCPNCGARMAGES